MHVRTNNRGPIRLWVPKSQIFLATDMPKKRNKTTILVHRHWLLASYDGRKAYVQNPDSKGERKCGV